MRTTLVIIDVANRKLKNEKKETLFDTIEAMKYP